MVKRYIFSGSLPEDATTYVTRKADTQLYERLKAGKFCYVLNSRQTGKSSLRVRTMRRLREEGFSCVAIDLSFGGIQYVTPGQWYVDLLDTLIDSLALDVDLEEWWEDHKLLSPLKRFRKLIEEVLLVEVREKIIIFIDEIDSVLSLDFPTDDFFGFIRACYNQRVDNPEYKRLSFCLLGVASPSQLIADKKRTPFNIGQAISLKGFEWEEVEPLKKGLQGKVGDPTSVMKEILEWTGGQPFLTQKLCQFVVEESDRDQPCSVEDIVRARIIVNWESQDEPEHLKTIRDRLLYRDEQRAGYLLELYQQIRQQGKVPLNDSLEQSELQLSGLVVKRQGKLCVTNPIYREVFNQNWIDEQLASLRPYSENFRAWVASGGEDESRFLRGQALILAEEWAKNKSLSYQDREFLAASKNKEIEEENKKAQLERERKDKEAELERERQAREVAEAANRQAQRRIRIGSIVLGVTLLGAIISVGWGYWQVKNAQTQLKGVEDTLDKTNEALEAVRDLSKLAGELRKKGQKEASNESLRKAGLSTLIENTKLKQAWLLAATAEAYPSLGDKGREQAQKTIKTSLDSLNNIQAQVDPRILNQVKAFAYFQAGKLLDKENYQDAYDVLKASNFNPYNLNIETDVLNEQDVEEIYYRLIKSRSIDINSESNEIAISFRKHLYDGLKFSLSKDRLQEADEKTWKIILYIADLREKGYLTVESLENFSCPALREIDALWYNYPQRPQHFGFRMQKEIWQEVGSPKVNLNSPFENWREFSEFSMRLGWDVTSSTDIGGFREVETSKQGSLPVLSGWNTLKTEFRGWGLAVNWGGNDNPVPTFGPSVSPMVLSILFSHCEL